MPRSSCKSVIRTVWVGSAVYTGRMQRCRQTDGDDGQQRDGSDKQSLHRHRPVRDSPRYIRSQRSVTVLQSTDVSFCILRSLTHSIATVYSTKCLLAEDSIS